MTSTQGASTLDYVYVGRAAYLRGNADYWRARHASSRVLAAVSGRWVRTTAASTPALSPLAAVTDPSRIASCLLHGHRWLVASPPRVTVDGRPAFALAESGAGVGSASSRLYLSTSGPPLPLRFDRTRRYRPRSVLASGRGGAAAPASARASITFSRFDQPVQISPPRGAIGLARLVRRLGRR